MLFPRSAISYRNVSHDRDDRATVTDAIDLQKDLVGDALMQKRSCIAMQR